MPQDPLHEWELKVVRGMIDEYRQEIERAKFVRGFWTTGRLVLVAAAGVIMFALQVIVLVVALTHGR